MSDFPRSKPLFLDDFSTNRLAEYDFATLLGATAVASDCVVSGGVMKPATAAKAFAFGPKAGRDLLSADGMARMDYNPGAGGSGYFGFIFRVVDANNYLWCRLYSGGVSLEIRKVDGGVGSLLASAGGNSNANTDYNFMLALRGNDILLLQNTGVWPLITPQNNVKYTLAGADATKFGGVVSPIWAYLNPGATDNSITNLSLLSRCL